MAVTINASTSAGLVQTADTTGNLSLQSNGTTIAALTSTGLAVTGAGSFSTTLGVTGTSTLAAVNASGAVTISASGAGLSVGPGGTSGNGIIYVNGGTNTNRGAAIDFMRAGVLYGEIGNNSVVVGGTDSDLAYWANTGLGHRWYTNGSSTAGMTLSSAGAVTIPGTLGVTGALTGSSTIAITGASVTITNAAPQLALNNTGASGRLWEVHSRVTTGYYAIIDSTAAQIRQSIDSSGIHTMGAYGAGAATFSAAGVISSVSDETWKTKDGIPTDPDVMLQKLAPGYWYYNDEKKETFGSERQLGFYAQNVNAAIGPEAAPEPETVTTKNEDGTETTITKPWGYYDRSVLAVTVMSLQKALATIESLTARITALEAK